MSDEATRESIIAAAEQAMAGDADRAEQPADVEQPEPAVQAVAEASEPGEEPAAKPAPESKLGTIIRAKRDAQRIRSEAQAEREALAKERAELEAFKARLKADPIAAIKSIGLTPEDINRHVVNEGTPEAEIVKLRQEIESERAARNKWQESIAARERQAAEDQFIAIAGKHATLSALYSDEPKELISRAYAVQEAYYAKTGLVPTREEIAEYLEEVEARRYAKISSKPVQAPSVSPKSVAKQPTRSPAPKSFESMTPAEQRRHLIAIAQHAEKTYRSQQ